MREAAERQQQQSESAAASAAPAQPKPKQAPAPKRKPAVPLVRVKPAKKQGTQQAENAAACDNRLVEGRPQTADEGQHGSGKAAGGHEGEPESPEDGLGGLLGAYGSDSDQN